MAKRFCSLAMFRIATESIHVLTRRIRQRAAPYLANSPPLPGPKSDPQFSPDGKEVYFLDAGRIQIVNVETRAVRPLAVTAELDV